jgi:hypothetical protein
LKAWFWVDAGYVAVDRQIAQKQLDLGFPPSNSSRERNPWNLMYRRIQSL